MKQEWLNEIHDHDSAVAFIRGCVARLGLAYHPDTPFGEYADDSGSSCFTPDEAQWLDALQEQAFAECDPYEVGSAEFSKLMPRQADVLRQRSRKPPPSR